nr:TolC family protein [bacterium 1xD42-67]
MKRRDTALLLSAVLALSLLGAASLAAEGEGPPLTGVPVQIGGAPEEDAAPSDLVLAAQTEGDASSEGEEEPSDVEEYIPDPVGTISFTNLERRLRENNYNLLALEETIASVEVIDYDKMTEDMRKQLNQIARAQWMMVEFGQGDSYAATALANSYSSLREVFDDLKDGVIQEDNAAIVRQLRNAQDQIVMAGESLYVAMVELELNDRGLDRSLDALDRTLQELELRYQLGHISSLTLQEAKGGRTALVSGKETLEMNLSNLKLQLELMIGAEQTGEIRLQSLPQVTAEQLAEMDLEEDLAAAKEASYELFAAKRTLEDAQEDFKDAGRDYSYNEKNFRYVAAQHAWQAAQHTYNAAVQNFENSFRTLYNQVKDYQQILSAAQTALAVEQSSYAAAQLKHEQGRLSQNGLLEAEDKVEEAREKVESAAIDLFSAYHNYRWAVDHGILN